MPCGDVPGDGEAETGSAVVAGAGLVEAYEALEDPLAFGGGHALAVVGDRQHRLPVRAPRGHGDRRVRVPLGVVQQVAQDDDGKSPSWGADTRAANGTEREWNVDLNDARVTADKDATRSDDNGADNDGSDD